MNKTSLLTILLFLLLCGGHVGAHDKQKHSFRLGENQFWLDEKPFQIISGEMHPARVPVEYWRHRVRMIKAMGCNTVACYVMWNYHESEPGKFDFQTGACRNLRHAESGTGMTSRIAEHFDKQLGSAIRHQMMIGEIIRGIDQRNHLDDPADAVQIAIAGILQGRQQIDRRPACGLLAFLDRDIAAELRHQRFAVLFGDMTGEINQIAGFDIHHISRHRFGHRRQRNIQRFQIFIYRHRAIPVG